MKRFVLKPRYNDTILEKPFNKGTLVGIIIGIAISKLIINIYLKNNFGLITGLFILLIGLSFWVNQYRGDKKDEN